METNRTDPVFSRIVFGLIYLFIEINFVGKFLENSEAVFGPKEALY
jgi:hypothetical protein